MKNAMPFLIAVLLCSSSIHAREFGALVVGKTVVRGWIVGECTDQGSRDQAIKCAEKKFKKNGGLLVTGVRDWQCKGWMATAVSAVGGYGIAWCRKTELEARADATSACMAANKGRDCAPIFSKDDTK